MAHQLAGLDDFLQSESLPAAYARQIADYYLPCLQRWLARRGEAVAVLGIHGAQGSGKSTLAAFYHWYLTRHCQLRVASLSLDDFYLSSAQRRGLAAQQHPLLATRGVPGSHDVALAADTLAALRAGRRCRLPRFDKARDEPRPTNEWPQVDAVDVVIFEGWCLAVPPQTEAELQAPVNALEAAEDSDGRWRSWVNAQLAGAYQQLFADIDYLLMLQAPSFDCVAAWRGEQEQKLARRRAGDASATFMNAEQIQRFISHYERLTRHALSVLPARADARLALDAQRRVTGLFYRQGEP